MQLDTLSAPLPPDSFDLEEEKPSGDWSITEPPFDQTKSQNLYVVECTVFTDGSYSFSDVSLSASFKASTVAYNLAKSTATSLTQTDEKINLHAEKLDANAQAITDLEVSAGEFLILFEEINSGLEDARKYATDFIQGTPEGLVIGDMTASMLGRNVLISVTDIQIRNGEAVLASFDEDDIYLGNETTRAALHLCGDRGIIEALTRTDGYDETWEELSLSTPHCLSLQSEAYISLGTTGVDVWNGNVTNAYLRVVSAFPWTDGETPVPFIEMYCNEYGDTEQAASLKLTPSGLYADCDLSLDGNLYLANLKEIYGTFNNSTTGQILGINNLDNICLGWAGYNLSKGATHIYGNSIRLLSKGSISLDSMSVNLRDTAGNLKSVISRNDANTIVFNWAGYTDKNSTTVLCGGNAVNFYVPNGKNTANPLSVGLLTGNTTYSGYFRPSDDGGVTLGTASNRFFRLYQSYSSVSTSDKRQKENIKALKNVRKNRKKKDGTTEEFEVYTELFDRLEPVEYNFIEGEKRKDFGLIAQDVLEVMAELGLEEDELDLVHHDTWIDEETGEEKDGYGIAYENLIAVLIHEVQKLKATVKYK